MVAITCHASHLETLLVAASKILDAEQSHLRTDKVSHFSDRVPQPVLDLVLSPDRRVFLEKLVRHIEASCQAKWSSFIPLKEPTRETGELERRMVQVLEKNTLNSQSLCLILQGELSIIGSVLEMTCLARTQQVGGECDGGGEAVLACPVSPFMILCCSPTYSVKPNLLLLPSFSRTKCQT